jgi:hypothetical protein
MATVRASSTSCPMASEKCCSTVRKKSRWGLSTPANTVPQGVVRVAGRRRMASELLGEDVDGARGLALYGSGVRLPQMLHERRHHRLLGQLRGPSSGQEDIVDVHHGESYMYSGVSPSNGRRSRRAQGTLTN